MKKLISILCIALILTAGLSLAGCVNQSPSDASCYTSKCVNLFKSSHKLWARLKECDYHHPVILHLKVYGRKPSTFHFV